MIACRSLFRFDTALRVTINFSVSSSSRQFQRLYFYRANYYLKIDTGEIQFNRMDRQKLNKSSYEWRKVSTQSSSHTEYEVNDLSMASQSSAFGDKGEKKGRHDPVVGGLRQESISAENESLAIEYSLSTGRHTLTLEVGASLMRFIKGKGGSTQQTIEDETGAKVIFPPSRKDDAITIEGNSVESVTNASRKIKAIINETVNSSRLDYSHFVSLPLALHPELVDKLVNFQKSILEASEGTTEVTGTSEAAVKETVVKPEDDISNKQFTIEGNNIPLVSYAPNKSKASSVELTTSKLSDMGIDSSIFIKPKTFHLTVLMLKLWNKERLEAAANVLQSVSSKVVDALDSRPISIRLNGLECMKGSFAKARVLYVPIEEVGEEGRLLRACQVIIDAFIEAGLVLERDSQHKLKLHATVMNVRHRHRDVKKKRNNDFFDASKIVEQYGSMEWGEFVICQAHLSERFAFDQNGYYHCCSSIPFS